MSWCKLDNPFLLKWYEPFEYVKSFRFERFTSMGMFIVFLLGFTLFSFLTFIKGNDSYFPAGFMISITAASMLSGLLWLVAFIPKNGAITSDGILIVSTYIKFDDIDFVSIGRREQYDKDLFVLLIHKKNSLDHMIAVPKGKFIDKLVEVLERLPVDIR